MAILVGGDGAPSLATNPSVAIDDHHRGKKDDALISLVQGSSLLSIYIYIYIYFLDVSNRKYTFICYVTFAIAVVIYWGIHANVPRHFSNIHDLCDEWNDRNITSLLSVEKATSNRFAGRFPSLDIVFSLVLVDSQDKSTSDKKIYGSFYDAISSTHNNRNKDKCHISDIYTASYLYWILFLCLSMAVVPFGRLAVYIF